MEMTAILFGLGLLAASAQAESSLTPAALLSRYPAGAVPDTDDVHLAIDALVKSGGHDNLSLLQSLQSHEEGVVKAHAEDASAQLAGRVLAEIRHEAARLAPSDREVRVWLGRHPELGGEVAMTEKRVIAYAALATQGVAWRDRHVGALTPEESALVSSHAEELELAGRVQSALPLYIDAALSGDARAVHALMARGIDMQRLALGLSSEHGARAGLPTLNTAPVVRNADPSTVSVLIGRAESNASLPRLAALENLGVLLRAGDLNAEQVKRVRRALTLAARDTRPAIRHTAQSALAQTTHP